MGAFAFLNPWALAALLALPALYFLLRITPPAPKTIRFPAARFLADLQPKENTPSHTPLWILLLRLLMAALLLLALARPVLNPATDTPQNGDLLLVVDTGWGAAQNWELITQTGEHVIRQNARAGKVVYIYPAARNTQSAELLGPFGEQQALSAFRGLSPLPWLSSLNTADVTIPESVGHAIWLHDGLAKRKDAAFTAQLPENTVIYSPQASSLPLVLKQPNGPASGPSVELDSPGGFEAQRPVKVHALSENGQILGETELEVNNSKTSYRVDFDIPATIQNQIASFHIAGQSHAAAKWFLDDVGGPKNVGIVSSEEGSQTRKLTEDSFYISKALEPYASISLGGLDELLKADLSMLILPDISGMPPDTLNALSEWVKNGGLLLRFAGPNMTQGLSTQDALLPVRLRQNSRSTEGALSWSDALKVSPIASESPLYGLEVEADIEISGQILPEVSDDLNDRVWVQLEDGTPLVTAAQDEQGLIVFVHTSASPGWSTLPLSGLYVQMLKRLMRFAGQSSMPSAESSGLLHPVRVMDGFGALNSPSAGVKPIDAQNFESVVAGPETPPGFYGRGGLQRALNLGDTLLPQRVFEVPDKVSIRSFDQDFEIDLMPYLLIAAFILFLIDFIVMLVLSGLSLKFVRTAIVLFCVGFSTPHAFANEAAEDLYLAYVETGDVSADALTRKGLEVLMAALYTRTSAEPKGVKAVRPEDDELAFYPFLYWALGPSQDAPSSKALQKLQHYLDHGGTILVDTRDGDPQSEAVRRVLGSLNIPPLTLLPDNHVLGRSFYLLESFPGRFNGRDIWVEGQSVSGRDGVSSVIIGSHDWAGAWAEINVIQRGDEYYISRSSQRHEMALRFGINLVMYALTGNYKTDQVHVPHILKRLGE